MTNQIYAHTSNGIKWHKLQDHLLEVARKAREFARIFGEGELAYWVGALHDIGKISQTFQDYLKARAENEPAAIVPHSPWGAALVYFLLWKQRKDDNWAELALPILGHHAGLYDKGEAAQRIDGFLSQTPQMLPQVVSYMKSFNPPLSNLVVRTLPPLRRELRIRMIFSALVDADYLDTEAHFNQERSAARGGWPTLAQLWNKLEEAQIRLINNAPDTPVNRVRYQVYQACLAMAHGRPGIYRLTVPTGGGKTRSGLVFALKHALSNGLRRIVIAIPYTSIIDQTVKVYRDILGNKSVLEHHSQVQYEDNESQDLHTIRTRLATENWDAPLIVTTTVQLFESLFSNRPGRTRKLHNLAKSVIVLDEVQALPPEMLEPTLDVLRSLVDDYGVSLVLSTATQPTFEEARFLRVFKGLEVYEIVPGYREHFKTLRRVQYEIRVEPVSWQNLAGEIRRYPQVMVVLNTRKDALALLDELGDDPTVFHLSTLLCGAHRRVVLDEIKRRLATGGPVRLISTQVVEAGVDLDFPVVYRAIGPLDRIVQAAGRCNREGKLSAGRVVVFEPLEGRAPSGPYKVGLEKAKFLLQKYPASALHDPEIYREYFRRLFDGVNLDKKHIQSWRKRLNYPEVARLYHLIEDNTVSVVVPYGDGLKRLDEWHDNPSRGTWQRLQPYLVGIYQYETTHLEREGWLEPITDGLYLWKGKYNEKRGITALHDPADLIR